MPQKIAFFTICSNNYLPYAQILFNSLKKFHPESSLFLCLADIKTQGSDIDGVSIIEARELNVPNFSDFAFRYDVMEFNTALKPFMMSWLIEKNDYKQVVYLDPDIEVFSPLQSVFDALNSGKNFVLTPHLTAPAEISAYPSDVDIMKAGIYNLGFIAVSNHTDVYYFLHWWARRLRFQCVNQQDQGIFVDQKFVDLLPAFFDNVAILRDTTLNVAYWNLEQRELTYYENENIWLIDNRPLTFFHFSGISPKNRHRLSKHTSRFNQNLSPALQAIIDHYIDQYEANIDANLLIKEYSYNHFDNGLFISDLMRRYYRELDNIWLEDPFKTFYQYLNETNFTILKMSSCSITNLMYALWSKDEGLRNSFKLNSYEDVQSYCRWFIQYSFHYKIDEYFVQPVLDRLTKNLNLASLKNLSHLKKNTKNLIGVVGYLKTETGVGQAGRLVAQSLERAGFSVQGLDVSINVHSRRDDNRIERLLTPKVDSPIHIYKVNADQLSIVKNHIASQINRADYQISMPAWELSIFPSDWIDNLSEINEIWVESEFVRASLQAKLSIPIYCMPPAITIDNFIVQDRQYFNLPQNTFLFHFNFDFASYSSRKNPEAVISAYRKAFRKKCLSIPTALVIKVRGYDPENQQLQRLMDATDNEQDIIIINKQLNHSDSLALMNCCDCYVSLHRSEGFGYTLAESMLLEKPVIATNFSGSKDFVTKSTGFPISHQLIPLNNGDYPFHENQLWADPDIDHAAWTMRKIVLDDQNTKNIAYNGQQYIKTFHSLDAAGKRYLNRLNELGIF
jgi:glycosyltransferase involved in cell wall biosynthesis